MSTENLPSTAIPPFIPNELTISTRLKVEGSFIKYFHQPQSRLFNSLKGKGIDNATLKIFDNSIELRNLRRYTERSDIADPLNLGVSILAKADNSPVPDFSFEVSKIKEHFLAEKPDDCKADTSPDIQFIIAKKAEPFEPAISSSPNTNLDTSCFGQFSPSDSREADPPTPTTQSNRPISTDTPSITISTIVPPSEDITSVDSPTNTPDNRHESIASQQKAPEKPTDLTNDLTVDSGISLNCSIDRSVKQNEKLDENASNTSNLNLTSKNVIPPFFYPFGKPRENERKHYADVVTAVRPIFKANDDALQISNFHAVTEKCALPHFANLCFASKIIEISSGSELKNKIISSEEKITLTQFTKGWKSLCQNYHDDYSLLFGIMRKDGSSTLGYDDFLKIIDDILENHVGLMCIHNHSEFQESYTETVLGRYFYKNGNFRCRLTLPQFRKSGFLEDLNIIHRTNNINAQRTIFSYNYFYVMYCKFIELDLDKDGYLTAQDLKRYDHGSLTSRIVNRIVDGHGIGKAWKKSKQGEGTGLMSYRDFIWFFISEIEKTSSTAIEYWFRCLDIDSDSVLSVYELEHFYEEQISKINRYAVAEEYKWADSYCEMSDLINPKTHGLIKLKDLKKSKLPHAFINCFINSRKYSDYEHRHQLAQQQRAQQELMKQRKEWYGELVEEDEQEELELGDFDKYVEEEYQLLAEADTRGQYYDSIEESDSGSDAEHFDELESHGNSQTVNDFNSPTKSSVHSRGGNQNSCNEFSWLVQDDDDDEVDLDFGGERMEFMMRRKVTGGIGEKRGNLSTVSELEEGEIVDSDEDDEEEFEEKQLPVVGIGIGICKRETE